MASTSIGNNNEYARKANELAQILEDFRTGKRKIDAEKLAWLLSQKKK